MTPTFTQGSVWEHGCDWIIFVRWPRGSKNLQVRKKVNLLQINIWTVVFHMYSKYDAKVTRLKCLSSNRNLQLRMVSAILLSHQRQLGVTATKKTEIRRHATTKMATDYRHWFRLNLSSLAGLQGYIPYPHRAAVCMFELDVLLLLGHMWGSIVVPHLWSRPRFSSSVLHVWFV